MAEREEKGEIENTPELEVQTKLENDQNVSLISGTGGSDLPTPECQRESISSSTDVVEVEDEKYRKGLGSGSESDSGDDDDEEEEEDEEEDEEDVITDEDETEEEYSDSITDKIITADLWICEKRHSGDGEEQPEKSTEKDKLDDDEDKQNPAYIPRKGSFFEHDLRLDDDRNDDEDLSKQTKKKLWYDKVKWQHDKFDERSQAPKSQNEIVAIYGFDIRANEKVPLDATRRTLRVRSNRKEKGKRLGDYVIFAKAVTSIADDNDGRQHVSAGGSRQHCPRRSWPENSPRTENAAVAQEQTTMMSLKTVGSSTNVSRGEELVRSETGRNNDEERGGKIVVRGPKGPEGDGPSPLARSGGGGGAGGGRRQGGGGWQFREREEPRQKEQEINKSRRKIGPIEEELRRKSGRIGTGRTVTKHQRSRENADDRAAAEMAWKRQQARLTGRVSRPSMASHNTRTIHNSAATVDRPCGGHSSSKTYSAEQHTIQSTAQSRSQDVRLLVINDDRRYDNDLVRGRSLNQEGPENDRNRTTKNAGGRKSTIIIHSTMSPDMIPPVTRISSSTKSTESIISGSSSSSSSIAPPPPPPPPARHQEVFSGATVKVDANANSSHSSSSYGWSGGEFIPSDRYLMSQSNQPRPKRYSSQRQKIGSDAVTSELTSDASSTSSSSSLALTTSSLSARPMPSPNYYGSAPPQTGFSPFPRPPVLPIGISSITYAMPVGANVAPGHIRLYNGPHPMRGGSSMALATAPPPSILHGPYMNAPNILQGPPYPINPSSVINFGPSLAQYQSLPPPPPPMAPVSMAPPAQMAPLYNAPDVMAGPAARSHQRQTEGAPLEVRGKNPNPLEVRGGTVYFNPELQKADKQHHGVVYFSPEQQATGVSAAAARSPVRRAKAAIPIVKPKDDADQDAIEVLTAELDASSMTGDETSTAATEEKEAEEETMSEEQKQMETPDETITDAEKDTEPDKVTEEVMGKKTTEMAAEEENAEQETKVEDIQDDLEGRRAVEDDENESKCYSSLPDNIVSTEGIAENIVKIEEPSFNSDERKSSDVGCND